MDIARDLIALARLLLLAHENYVRDTKAVTVELLNTVGDSCLDLARRIHKES